MNNFSVFAAFLAVLVLGVNALPLKDGNVQIDDMIFTAQQYEDRKNGRNAITAWRWPTPVIPMTIDPNFSIEAQWEIYFAYHYIEEVSCIRFVAYNPAIHQNWINIVRPPAGVGCNSFVGMVGGGQTINLESPGCFGTMTTAQHEILHALGFLHMQSTATRDNYLRVLLENVQPGQEHNFELAQSADLLGTPYDFLSIMQYDLFAFSRNPGVLPVFALAPGQTFDLNRLGSATNLTPGDALRLNRLYHCPQTAEPKNHLSFDEFVQTFVKN